MGQTPGPLTKIGSTDFYFLYGLKIEQKLKLTKNDFMDLKGLMDYKFV